MTQKIQPKYILFFKPKPDPQAYSGADIHIEVFKDKQLYCSFGIKNSEDIKRQLKSIVKSLKLVGVEKIHSVKNETKFKNLPKLKDLRETYKTVGMKPV